MRQQLLEARYTNDRINVYLIDHISAAGMKCSLSKRGGRTRRRNTRSGAGTRCDPLKIARAARILNRAAPARTPVDERESDGVGKPVRENR